MSSFFVSYNRADKAIAEWIAWILEEEQHTVIIQAWDFRPGGNFILDMQRAATNADKTIVVLSTDYLNAKYTQPEWAAAFTNDPESLTHKLVPIRVDKCNPTGLLRSIVYVDLVGLEEDDARQAILAALQKREKPSIKPAFPLSGKAQKERMVPEKPRFPEITAASIPWNVPYERNPFFTGREDVLEFLHQQLRSSQTAAISQTQAISGLGGVGKTQTAVEYAYRYRQDYQAVFWIRAETKQELWTGFVEIARLLNLPQQAAQDSEETVQAVKRWLDNYVGWLLIFDNADHPDVAQSLNNLAGLYENQGSYSEAESLYQKALEIYGRVLDGEHPNMAQTINNLALVYHNQERCEEARLLYQEALAMRKQLLGAKHPDVAESLNNLAGLYESQGHDDKAESLYQEAMRLFENALGSNHPFTKTVSDNLKRLRNQ